MVSTNLLHSAVLTSLSLDGTLSVPFGDLVETCM